MRREKPEAMAEAVVRYAIQKIGDAIINEALFLRGVNQQVEDLKQELRWMESFLQEADTKARGGSNMVQQWVRLVMEAAHEAEDLIESIVIQGSDRIHRRDFFRKLMPRALIRRHNFGLDIEELNKKIINIRVSKRGYGIGALPDDPPERMAVDNTIAQRTASPRYSSDSSNVVLMEGDKEAILHRLDPKREKRRSVTSIVGMGGLGKTTLANKVFNDSRIEKRFDCAFWIDVSQDYNDVKLLKDLLCEIYPEESKKYESMKKTSLKRCLHESLQGKTYLIVMDDVWDIEFGRIIEANLPDEDNGSKVLITTRNHELADAADPDPDTRAYELEFLNEEESCALFLSKAIHREEERSECPEALKRLGEEMAANCGGLPLALVVMGSLLSQKQRTREEWMKVSKSMFWRYERQGQKCLKSLGLSYADLPYDLKWCFLYLCAFPKDFEIDSDRLIRLWIAEGFIEEREDRPLEETAEIQLKQLIERSLVHVVFREPYDGVIRCRVHDLLRELCISEAKKIDFMSVHQGMRPLPPESLRRLSAITEPEETISQLKSAKRLRALLGFNFRYYPAMNLSVGGLKLIRVIDLQQATNLNVLPFEIGGLVNLRYLGLKGTSIKSLPETIKNLSRLQFLDVRGTQISQMTSAVWEMKTLRQVFFPKDASAPDVVHCSWKSLQVLYFARAGHWMNGSLDKMKDIQTLDLWSINDFNHDVLSSNLPKFSSLKILQLQGPSIPWTALTLSGLPVLRTLLLRGPIIFPKEVRPELRASELDYGWPEGLTYLELHESDLHRDPLPSLGLLSELRFLILGQNSYNWQEEMKFRGDGFQQLQELRLPDLDHLERMIVEDGAMPRLQKFTISDRTRG